MAHAAVLSVMYLVIERTRGQICVQASPRRRIKRKWGGIT